MAFLEFSFNKIELTDGRTFESVDTLPADHMLWETVSRKQGFGSMQESPLTFQYFIAFAALRRTGNFDGDFNAFKAALRRIDIDEGEAVDPTNAADGDD